jgi:CBS domain-containing protein
MSTAIGTLASTVVAVVEPDTTALMVAQLMRQCHVGALVVVDSETRSRAVGIVTDRDLVLELIAEGLDPAVFTAGDIMTVDLLTSHVNTDTAQAVQLMKTRGVRRLVLVDDKERLVGIVSMEDVLARMAQELTELVSGLSLARARESKDRQ